MGIHKLNKKPMPRNLLVSSFKYMDVMCSYFSAFLKEPPSFNAIFTFSLVT